MSGRDRAERATSDARVDVVIPVRNGSPTITRAVESVRLQEGVEWRLWVVDDGSTDDSAAIVESMADPRIEVIRAEPLGVSAARNRGAALGSAEFLVFLDADDAGRPGWLEALIPSNEVGLVQCGGIRRGSGWGDQPEAILVHHSTMLAGMFLVRRELFEAVGGYDERLAYSENTDLEMLLTDECERRGLRTERLSDLLVEVHRDGDRVDRYSHEWRLRAAELILEKHSDRCRRSPEFAASYHAVAGYHALRLGQRRRARHHYWCAVRRAPSRLKYWPRLVQALTPTIG